MGSRRRGREMALQVLCLLERQPDLSIEQGLHLYFRHLSGSELDDELQERGAAAESPQQKEQASVLFNQQRRFAEALVRGVRSSLTSIDTLLGHCSRNWRLERMSWVDRNLLRLACFELGERKDTPARVVINEAIEIARRYSTTESSGFVNGVLDRVMRELERRESSASTELGGGDHAPSPH